MGGGDGINYKGRAKATSEQNQIRIHSNFGLKFDRPVLRDRCSLGWSSYNTPKEHKSMKSYRFYDETTLMFAYGHSEH